MLDEQFNFTEVRRKVISWENLTYEIPAGGSCFGERKQKTVLKNVSGVALPGELTAVMGPTGCGKSTLLNALAGRLHKVGVLSGEVLVNGALRADDFYGYSAYSLQDDALFGNLTVRETFWVVSHLRLPAGTSRQQRQSAVEELIKMMGLSGAADTYKAAACGGASAAASASVDEPTSGLDSFQAQSVLEALRGLAEMGRTVVIVIHQPRSSIFQMFDRLCVLSQGRALYMGVAAKSADHFAQIGFPCPQNFNTADFILDLVSIDSRTPESEANTAERVEKLARHFEEQSRDKMNNVEVQVEQPASQPPPKGRSIGTRRPGFFRQFGVLFWRSLRQNARNHVPNAITLVQSVLIAVLLGLIYQDIEMNQTGIKDRLGVLFFVTINTSMSAVFTIIQVFPAEKGIVSRERDSQTYSVAAYFASKYISEMPFKIFGPIVNGIILYWAVGLNPAAEAFFFFLLLLATLGLCAAAIGLAVGAWCPTQEVTFAVAPLIMIVFMLFGGFFIKVESLPTGSEWVAYLSPMLWGFVGVTTNDLRGLDGWECEPAASSNTSSAPGEQEDCNLVRECSTTGENILEKELDFAKYTRWEALMYLVLVGAGVLFVGYLGLVVTGNRYQPLSQERRFPRILSSRSRVAAGRS
eukprot:CAMPEP_0177626464 /NCGR_PEP_ID=MMETSP0419_2-20121207/30668_1 /TAXON_ID=582737 /ORGANISM="Tetraselmis sp., Strain GSL018" /LENGTH=638 /DNA_ID=CAMNT_0019127521 /DNA_START=142 /DNA_END=2059 /DNA_ORIENTATION=-